MNMSAGGEGAMGNMNMDDTPTMRPAVGRGPLIFAVVLTLLMLTVGIGLAARFGDLSMSSQSMSGSTIDTAGCGPGGQCTAGNTTSQSGPCKPPSMSGMVMAGECTPTPAAGNMSGASGGHNMSPVDVTNATAADPNTRGNQPLTYTLAAGGVKQFELTASVIKWNILPDVQLGAYAYNGQVPGPEIRVTEGDKIRVVVHNQLPEATSIHWHGLQIPNDMDGVADVTQPPIAAGGVFTYEYTMPNTPGTYFYHTHKDGDRQQPLGLYGALIIESKNPTVKYDAEYTVMLGEWRVTDGKTYPAMDFDGMLPNYFTINGKSYPATETIKVKQGQQVLLRFIGSGQFIHPMHLHGQPFKIVATDGNSVPEAAQLTKSTVLVGPGETYDVVFTARAPGKWLLHCHINHHITNNGQEVQGGGGLTMIIEVTP